MRNSLAKPTEQSCSIQNHIMPHPQTRMDSTKLVYDSSLFSSEFQPYAIYIPNDLVMLQIFRSCLYCKSYSETVFGMQEAALAEYRRLQIK